MTEFTRPCESIESWFNASAQQKKAPQSPIIAIRDEDLLHALRDAKKAYGGNLPQEFFEELPQKLKQPDEVFLQPKKTFKSSSKLDTLIFVFKLESGKVAIKIGYKEKINDEMTGKKKRILVNMVRTASVLSDNTSGLGRYDKLK